MKPTHTFLLIAAVSAAMSLESFAATSLITLRNLEDVNRFRDSGGAFLDAGTPDTVNGNGALVELGYFSTNTAAFDGAWNVVAEFRVGDFYLQNGSISVPDGEFLTQVQFDDASTGLPSSDTQMAMRFYEGTDNTTDNYNTVTHSAWKFAAPATIQATADYDVNNNSDTLAWESTSLGQGAGNEFRTTIVPVPEPSSAALLGLGMTALLLRRRK